MPRYLKNIQAMKAQLQRDKVIFIRTNGVPTATTGIPITGTGSNDVDTTGGLQYKNVGTNLAPTWNTK